MKKVLLILAAALLLFATSCSKGNGRRYRVGVEHTTQNLWFTFPAAPKTFDDYYVNIKCYSDHKAVVRFIHLDTDGGQWHVWETLVNEKGVNSGFTHSIELNPSAPSNDTTVVYYNIRFKNKF